MCQRRYSGLAASALMEQGLLPIDNHPTIKVKSHGSLLWERIRMRSDLMAELDSTSRVKIVAEAFRNAVRTGQPARG